MLAFDTELSGDGPAPPRRRRGLLITRLAMALLGVVAATALIANGSRAAFSDTTDNPANNWAAGTVVLTDDDTAAMFNASDLAPGDSVVNCIAVTYQGSLVPANVRLYGTATGSLGAYLDLTVDIGTGGGFGDCTGFAESSSTTLFTGTLSEFATAHTNFGDGLAGWSPAATPESRTYRFTVSVQDNNKAQGLDATATFTWEAQNQ